MMDAVLVCLVLASLRSLGGLHAAALPASTVQVQVGQNATLHCPLLAQSSGPALNASSTLSWYRKSAGRGPELLVSIRTAGAFSLSYGSTAGPGKVSATPDGSLLLHRAERSDSAVYFCGISQGDQQKEK